MKVLFIELTIVLIYLMVKYISRKYLIINDWINLIVIIFICFPNFKLGSISLSMADIFIFILFIYLLSKAYIRRNTGKCEKFKLLLILYSLMIIISILVSFFLGNNEYITSLLKGIKFIECTMIYIITSKFYIIKEDEVQKTINYMLISSIISSVIAIILFIIQIPTPQQMWISGRVLYRAAGVYGEATSLGNMMLISIIISTILLLKLNSKHTWIILINILLNFIALLLSYSRGPIIALTVVFILITLNEFINYKDFKILKYFIIIVCLILGLACFNESIKFMIEMFVEQRIMPLLNISKGNFNDISSGRGNVWINNLEQFINLPIIYLLVGTGYKVNINIDGIKFFSDNNYISSLTQMGIFGFIIFLLINIQILKIIRLKINSNIYKSIKLAIFFTWIGNMVQMLTVDSFTYNKQISVIFVLIAIVNLSTNIKNNINEV